MTTDEILCALDTLAVQTGSLACLGCGHEHNCGIHGCAIIREAEETLRQLSAEKAALLEYAKTKRECEMCKHDGYCPVQNPTADDCRLRPECPDCPCGKPNGYDCWEWRGLPESLKEGASHE